MKKKKEDRRRSLISRDLLDPIKLGRWSCEKTGQATAALPGTEAQRLISRHRWTSCTVHFPSWSKSVFLKEKRSIPIEVRICFRLMIRSLVSFVSFVSIWFPCLYHIPSAPVHGKSRSSHVAPSALCILRPAFTGRKKKRRKKTTTPYGRHVQKRQVV